VADCIHKDTCRYWFGKTCCHCDISDPEFNLYSKKDTEEQDAIKAAYKPSHWDLKFTADYGRCY